MGKKLKAQAFGEPMDQKRAVFVLRQLAPDTAGRQDIARLIGVFEALSEFALHAVEVLPRHATST